MFGFLTFGTTLTFLDQAFKARIEKEEKGTFPRELAISKGKIKIYQNHNEGFSFGILKGSRAVQLVPLCVTSAFAGAWAYLMGTRGRILEKLALTLTLAGGVSCWAAPSATCGIGSGRALWWTISASSGRLLKRWSLIWGICLFLPERF